VKGLLSTILVTVAVALGAAGLALTILLVTFLKRQKARRALPPA
jgi:hypothetical protein